MKQLTIYSGGHPITGNDLTHLNSALVETLTSMMKGLLSNGGTVPNCLLYGFNYTPGFPDDNYSAGAAVLDGEICIFDGQNVASSALPPGYHWVITPLDTYAAGNPVTYADASTKNVHLIRKCQIVATTAATAANEIDLDLRTFFTAELKSNLFSTNTAWRYPGDPGEPAFNGAFNTGFPWTDKETTIRFCKLINDQVLIEGEVVFDEVASVSNLTTDITPASPMPIFTLPAGYRPDKGLSYQIGIAVTTPSGMAYFDARVTNTGNVELIGCYNYGSVTPGDFGGTNATGRFAMEFRVA